MRYWQLSQGLCIVAHIGMATTGFIFAMLGGQSVSIASGNNSTTSKTSPRVNSSIDPQDVSMSALPWLTVAVGSFSSWSNIILLMLASVFESKERLRTTRLTFQKAVSIIAYLGNFGFGAADAVLLGFWVSHIGQHRFLEAPLAFSAIAAIPAFATASLYIAHHHSLNQREEQELTPEEYQKYYAASHVHVMLNSSQSSDAFASHYGMPQSLRATRMGAATGGFH